MWKNHGKRLFDIIVTIITLLLLLPVLCLIAILVRLRLGSPIIFKQERPGRDTIPFTIYKFRTMTDDRDSHGGLLPDAARLTPFGAWLRRTSLDELPEFLNVLRGHMSLVGPRPLLTRYTEYFTPEEMVRFYLRPGITGAAQIAGRNDASWDHRVGADLRYVSECSLCTDLKIL